MSRSPQRLFVRNNVRPTYYRPCSGPRYTAINYMSTFSAERIVADPCEHCRVNGRYITDVAALAGNYFTNIKLILNACAHGTAIIDFAFPYGSPYVF